MWSSQAWVCPQGCLLQSQQEEGSAGDWILSPYRHGPWTQTGYTAFSSAETPSQMAAKAQKGSDWSKVTQLPMADPQLLADEKRLDARMPHYDPVEPL